MTGRLASSSTPGPVTSLLVHLVLLALAGTVASASLARTLTAGDAAPTFRLPDIWGERNLTSDSLLTGTSNTLILIWNTECPDCLADLSAISDLLNQTDPLPLIAVGICTDTGSASDARRLIRGMKLPFPNLWDSSRSVAARYGASEVSFSAFLIDAERKIRLAWYDHPESPEALFDAILEAAAESPPDRPGGESDDHREPDPGRQD